MARICVVGSGYVGTVVAAGLAEIGHRVVALEEDPVKRSALSVGLVPFHEPGLPDLLQSGVDAGRLTFTGDPSLAMAESDVVFLCVGTPSDAEGRADLSALGRALAALRANATHSHVLVTKSTVPIGTHAWIHDQLQPNSGVDAGNAFSLVSNPEFLRQGRAVHDFLNPERVVLGSDSDDALAQVEAIYRPILDQSVVIDLSGNGARRQKPVMVRTSLATAETIKYASNAFLATKISFANEMAGICEAVGADITEVVAGMGLDARIGSHFLDAGLGWGGSCFGKDVLALISTAESAGMEAGIIQAAHRANFMQRQRVVEKVSAALGGLAGRHVALLGLSFKPHTDDLRDAPSLDIAARLIAGGARVSAHDPVVRDLPEGLPVTLARDAYTAAAGAHATVLVTEWPEYQSLDLRLLSEVMGGDLLFDGRNVLDPRACVEAGLTYMAVGRPSRTPPNNAPAALTSQSALQREMV